VFQVEDVPPDHPPYEVGFTQYVVDHERGVWLEYIGSPHTEPPEREKLVFRFFWDEHLLLVEANVFAGPNKKRTPAEGHETEISSFGYSAYGTMRTGLRPDPLGRERVIAALPVLAEALLVYGMLYDGDLYPDRIIRGTFYDVPMRWTWADFGYTVTLP
jgi:hypothetical protein